MRVKIKCYAVSVVVITSKSVESGLRCATNIFLSLSRLYSLEYRSSLYYSLSFGETRGLT